MAPGKITPRARRPARKKPFGRIECNNRFVLGGCPSIICHLTNPRHLYWQISRDSPHRGDAGYGTYLFTQFIDRDTPCREGEGGESHGTETDTISSVPGDTRHSFDAERDGDALSAPTAARTAAGELEDNNLREGQPWQETCELQETQARHPDRDVERGGYFCSVPHGNCERFGVYGQGSLRDISRMLRTTSFPFYRAVLANPHRTFPAWWPRNTPATQWSSPSLETILRATNCGSHRHLGDSSQGPLPVDTELLRVPKEDH